MCSSFLTYDLYLKISMAMTIGNMRRLNFHALAQHSVYLTRLRVAVGWNSPRRCIQLTWKLPTTNNFRPVQKQIIYISRFQHKKWPQSTYTRMAGTRWFVKANLNRCRISGTDRDLFWSFNVARGNWPLYPESGASLSLSDRAWKSILLFLVD